MDGVERRERHIVRFGQTAGAETAGAAGHRGDPGQYLVSAVRDENRRAVQAPECLDGGVRTNEIFLDKALVAQFAGQQDRPVEY